MRSYFKNTLLFISAAAFVVVYTAGVFAQSTGPAALAAKQDVKSQVLAAMSDGNVSPNERRDILTRAKDILSAKEYVGLVNTINRLSPPDKSVNPDLGYTPLPVDKQMMANFFAPDLSSIRNSKIGGSIVKELFPNQTNIAKQTPPKQMYIVKEIITKQTVVSAAPTGRSDVKATDSKQAIAKKTASTKQNVAKAQASKQPAAKSAKSNASPKTSEVVLIPPPPLDDENILPRASALGKTQKTSTSANSSAPLPPAGSQSNSADDKPLRQKISESLKKLPAARDQVAISQPANLFNVAEKSSNNHLYADYSVPVLTTPAAALLTDRKSNTLQASFDELLEPESNQGIIRR
jgi:hypothetical protein